MTFEFTKDIRFEADKYLEKDGNVTISLKDMDIVANGVNLDEVKASMANELMEYAEEYYREFDLYSKAPDCKAHLPYVIEILAAAKTIKAADRIGIAEGRFTVPNDFDADNDNIAEMFGSDNE